MNLQNFKRACLSSLFYNKQYVKNSGLKPQSVFGVFEHTKMQEHFLSLNFGEKEGCEKEMIHTNGRTTP